MEQKYYLCLHCGNLVALLCDGGAPLYCCGEPMQELHPDTEPASGEKHQPVCRVEGNRATVTVGMAAHPMTPEHFIVWVALETTQGVQYAHLRPGMPPQAEFALLDGEQVRAACAFCNQHKLWRTSICQ